MSTAEIYSQLFKLASASSDVQEVVKFAQTGRLRQLLTARNLGILGLGGLGAGIPAYLTGRSQGESSADEKSRRTRNLAFGAGVASGLVAPSVVKALSRATGLGLSPGAADEEFMSI